MWHYTKVSSAHFVLQHDITLDPSQPATAFKQSIYEKTGVPLDRQKVMIKGGMLKDDSDLSKIGARPVSTVNEVKLVVLPH